MALDSYLLQILLTIGIGIILAMGLTIITGFTGQLSLGHAAFMSIGAFSSALLAIHTGLPYPLILLLSGLASAVVAASIGWPILRLSGDYLAICTLGFAEILKVVLLNLDFTNRALGLSVPAVTGGISLPFMVFVTALLVTLATAAIAHSRLGIALKAIRDDEIAAEASGINLTRYKVGAFAIGGFMAGLGGSLYAHVISYINPSDFGFIKSIDILSMVVLGGLGSVPGTVLGATVLAALPELLRFMAQYRMLVYGVLLVVMMVFRPSGLLGSVRFTTIIPLLKRRLGRSR